MERVKPHNKPSLPAVKWPREINTTESKLKKSHARVLFFINCIINRNGLLLQPLHGYQASITVITTRRV